MTVLTTSAGQLAARQTSRTAGFRVELLRDWRQAVARWQDSSPSTPFQHPQWYDAWYRAFADAEGIEPLIAVVTDASTGEPVVLLPLIRRRQNNIATVEFAVTSMFRVHRDPTIVAALLNWHAIHLRHTDGRS